MNTGIVLLVEDNQDDAELTIHSLKSYGLANDILHISNGPDALDYLNGATAMPSIILLDLRMPRMDGLEVLSQLQSSTSTRSIPVVILTASKEELDQVRSRQLGAVAHIIKPVDVLQFVGVLASIGLTFMVLDKK